MLERESVEKSLDHLIEEHGIGLTIFSPLKQGILTGKYNNGNIPEGSRFSDSKDPWVIGKKSKFADGSMNAELKVVRKLEPIAKKLGISQAQLAYAWVLRNKNVSSAITGASRREQVYDAVRAVGMVKMLTSEVLEEIEKALGNKPVLMPRRIM